MEVEMRLERHLGALLRSLGFFVVVVVCFLNLFYFWLHCVSCRILVPNQESNPCPTAVEAWSPNHWTAREPS